MKHSLLLLGAVLACVMSATTLAGYADDRAEIENLSNRYMIAVDSGDMDSVMATWTADGTRHRVGPTVVEHGEEAIRVQGDGRLFPGSGKEHPEGATSWPRSRHFILNHVIDVACDC